MKKYFVAQAVLLATLSGNSLSAFADDNVVVVTANRFEQDITDTLADVEIISRVDIERIQPRSLIDLLANISGIDSIQRGGHAQDASVFVRGANSNQVLLLIDGIRVGSATLGAKSVSNISISQIEKIEIVKGPRAALWGSDAIGGVIQIFTRRYQSQEHRVGVTLGSNNTSEIDASIGFGDDKLNSTITVSHSESEGIDARIDDETDDDGYQNNSISIRGGYVVSETGIIDWTAQADKGDNEFDNIWGGNKTFYNNHHWGVRYTQLIEGWNNQYSFNRSRDSNYSTGNGIVKEFADRFETNREQFTVLTRKSLNDTLSMSGGVEWVTDNIERTSGEFPVKTRESKSAQLGINFIGKAFLADLAIRFDDVQHVSSEVTRSLSVGYRITQDQLISLNYGEGFKAPTFNDLYYPYGGNPDLNFETSDNLEMVYKLFFANSSFNANVYQSKVDNLIQWIPNSDFIWTPQNVGEAKVNGIDLSLQLSQDEFSHQLTASYIEAEDAATNTQLLRRAKEHAGYEITYSNEGFEWFAQIQYIGKRPDNDYLTFMPTQLDSYTRINLGVGYAFNSAWKLQLKINDASDEAPTSVSGYYPIEREFYLTISHQNLL